MYTLGRSGGEGEGEGRGSGGGGGVGNGGGGAKLELDYPCRWIYKIIGEDETALRGAIRETVISGEYEVSLSRRSRNGRYHCLKLELVVYSDQGRVKLFHALRSHPAVKVVL